MIYVEYLISTPKVLYSYQDRVTELQKQHLHLSVCARVW